MTSPYMHLYIYGEHYVDDVLLPHKSEGKFWIHRTIDGKSVPFVEVYVHHHTYYMHANALCQFLHKQEQIQLNVETRIQVVSKEETLHLVISAYEKESRYWDCYTVEDDELYIGRDATCDIQYRNRFVSAQHARLWKEDTVWWMEDLQSSNGVYVNGKRMQRCQLQSMDMAQIWSLRLLMGEGCIHINKVNQCHVSKCFTPYKIEEIHPEVNTMNIIQTNYTIPPTHPACTLQVDSPPPLPSQKRMPLLFVIGPALTMGLSSISMGVFSLLQMKQQQATLLQSIPTLIMAFSMGAGTLLWPLLSRRYEKRENYRLAMVREDRYHQYLMEIEAKIQQELQSYQAYQCKLYHNTVQCYQTLKIHKLIRYTKEHPAFKTVTLGSGILPCPITFDYHCVGFSMEQDALQNELQRLCEKVYCVEQVPIVLPLYKMEVVHIAGDDAMIFMMQLLYQFIATHDDHDVRLVCFLSREDAFTYGVLWMPHALHKSTQIRYVVCNEQDLQDVYEDICCYEKTVQLYTFFFTNDLKTKWELYIKHRSQSITTICLEEEIHCTNESKHAYIACHQGQGMYIHDFKTIPFTYQKIEGFDYRLCVQVLANANVNHVQEMTMPTHVHFLDMYRCGNVKQLHIEKRWLEHDASKSLQVPIGLCASREILYLDAHERYDGAHGLFAGMTGSGKSECLLTYILSLAVNFSPRDVSFLLIDYKGGGMAKVCASLPHIAGIITNLDQDMMQRALFALQNELTRRQRLFNESALQYEIGNMNIDIYQQLSKEHVNMIPLSHLFIIADEFAELKVAQHEFMEELKKSARIGRSLGIHLLLATQKPAGVIDDQIWSNAHFHLCMKVQSTQDSQDMLKKDDAAYLKTTGECYLQVGLDEVYKKGQIAWSGELYYECDDYEEIGNNEVSLLQPTNTVLMTKTIQRNHKNAKKTQMEAVIEEIIQVASCTVCIATPLWMDALSKELYANSYQYANIMVDDMKHQKQFAITFDSTWLHHMLLYGMYSKDKEVFLISYIYFLVSLPSFVATYIFDFDTHELSKFKGYKHIMDVVCEHEEEKLNHFFYQMESELKARKEGGRIYPIVWILHNYEVFHELYEPFEHRLLWLLREGKTYGLYILMTTTSSNSISYRLTQYIANTIVFHMYDEHEYRQLLPSQHTMQPTPHCGSGIVIIHKEVVPFQTLLFTKEDIVQLPQASDDEIHYRIAMMPSIVQHALSMKENKLYLGKDCESVNDVYWDLNSTGCFYVLWSFQFFKPFYTMIFTSLKNCEDVYIMNRNQMLHLGETIKEEKVVRVLYSTHPKIFVWLELPYNTNESIQRYVKEENMHMHTHIICCKMEDYMEYARYPWFQRNLQESRCCWIGKGFEEHRYTLRFTSTIQYECKSNEALLWEDDTCIKLQLWEEELHG